MFTPEKRFQEHLKAAQRQRNQNRPLYNAIQHYGTNSFELTTIEECSSEVVNEREKYWISYYNSYKEGYNATLGGDGTHYLDYSLIVETYNSLLSRRETAKVLGISEDTVTKVLEEKQINYTSPQEVIRNKYGKSVKCYSLIDESIQTFDSLCSAARFLIEKGLAKGAEKGVMAHIRDAANGKRKTAYKYKWEFM